MKLYAKQILTSNGWQSDKTLIIANGIITEIVDGCMEGAEIADGPVIPGMVNCHSHAFQRAFAGMSEQGSEGQDSFWTWRKVMYGFLAQITPEQAQIIATELYIEMLKAGYTSVGEFHYLHHQPSGENYSQLSEMSECIFEAAQTSGIALTHLPVLYRYSGFGAQQPTDGQRRFINDADSFNRLVSDCIDLSKKYPQSRVGMAPHSLRATNLELLNDTVGYLKSLDANAPIHIHIAEQQQEVNDCLAVLGERPVQWLYDNQVVDKHWCLIHATHLTVAERQALARSGAVAGICPTTEANLGDGIFPTTEYLAEGGALAIGSDSHISISPIEELRWLEYVQRLIKQQRAILATPQQPSVGANLWQRAAIGGAQSLGRNAGELAIGKKADLLVLDQEKIELFASSQQHLLDSFIFASQQNQVKDVMVAGRWVVKNYQHKAQQSSAVNYKSVLKNLTASL